MAFMRRRKNLDPRWITAKFNSQCKECRQAVKKNSPAFWYPLTKTIFCEQCGSREYKTYVAITHDETMISNSTNLTINSY